MAAAGRGLPTVGPFAGNDVHLVILRTANDIARHLGVGRRGGIESSAAGTTVAVATAGLIAVEGSDDAGELDRGIRTILVAAHVGTLTPLPFVVAVQVDVEFLTAMEGIELRKTDLYLRTVTAVSPSDEVCLGIEAVRLVEHAVQQEVEGICVCPGSKLEIGGAEDTRGVDLACGLEIFLIGESLAGT